MNNNTKNNNNQKVHLMPDSPTNPHFSPPSSRSTPCSPTLEAFCCCWSPYYYLYSAVTQSKWRRKNVREDFHPSMLASNRVCLRRDAIHRNFRQGLYEWVWYVRATGPGPAESNSSQVPSSIEASSHMPRWNTADGCYGVFLSAQGNAQSMGRTSHAN